MVIHQDNTTVFLECIFFLLCIHGIFFRVYREVCNVSVSLPVSLTAIKLVFP